MAAPGRADARGAREEVPPDSGGKSGPRGGPAAGRRGLWGGGPLSGEIRARPGSSAEGETPEAGAEVGVQRELGLGRRKR